MTAPGPSRSRWYGIGWAAVLGLLGVPAALLLTLGLIALGLAPVGGAAVHEVVDEASFDQFAAVWPRQHAFEVWVVAPAVLVCATILLWRMRVRPTASTAITVAVPLAIASGQYLAVVAYALVHWSVGRLLWQRTHRGRSDQGNGEGDGDRHPPVVRV